MKMAQGTCIFFILAVSFCCSETSSLEEHSQVEQEFHNTYRQLFANFPFKTVTQHDGIYPPIGTVPTGPVTVLPATNPPPTIVTVPSTNPVTATPNPDATPAVPITNPVTTPSTTTPVTNPVTTYPSPTTGVPATTPVTNPVVTPATGVPATGAPATGGSAAVPGQSWCVAKSGASEAAIQAALDYACGIGGADCSAIQQGASCYNPASLENHASYAFNSYYQKNPGQTSCDFGGSATITTTNPSTGTCVYPTSSSSSPTTTSPPMTGTTPTPNTESSGGGSLPGSITPPSVLNSSNPASVDGTSGFGETPPGFNSSISMSISLQPYIGLIVLATSTVAGRIILDL